MAGTQLTPGAVPKFFTLSQSELADFHPVVQINAVKAADASKSKYKLLVSDGSHYVTAVSVGAELKEKIEKDEIGKHTVLRVMRCSCHNTPTNGGKPLLLIVDVSVLDKPTEKIGNPQKMEESEIRQLTAGGTITSTNNTAGRPTNAMAAGGMTGTQPSTQVYPIASLNPYQNKWTIKARAIHNARAMRLAAQSLSQSRPRLADLDARELRHRIRKFRVLRPQSSQRTLLSVNEYRPVRQRRPPPRARSALAGPQVYQKPFKVLVSVGMQTDTPTTCEMGVQSGNDSSTEMGTQSGHKMGTQSGHELVRTERGSGTERAGPSTRSHRMQCVDASKEDDWLKLMVASLGQDNGIGGKEGTPTSSSLFKRLR